MLKIGEFSRLSLTTVKALRFYEKEVEIAEDCAVVLLADYKVRRMPEKQYKPEDVAAEGPLFTFHTRTDARLRLFTDLGSVLHIAVKDLPETRPNAKSANLAALLPFEANEKILSAIAEKGAGTVSIRPLGVEAKLVRGAEAGGRVLVRPVSAMDRPAVVAAVKSLGGEVLPASPVAEQGALVCKLSRKAVLDMAARPDVWSIERYGK